MKLFNTLGRQLQDFTPQQTGSVSLYTCGPTVYDYAHIGNLRAFVFNDTLRRVLESEGYTVKHVMNITDVGHLASDADEGEDKLEAGASREQKTVWEVAEQYIQAFKNDVDKLNILPPNAYHKDGDLYARATDFISQQIEIVQILIDKGNAYQTKEAIYFDVSKLDSYGELTGQRLSDKEVGARSDVVVDKDKHHPQDFAVWFFKVGRFAGHSMAWPTPWGEGFPGWHLECSAIIHDTLGEPIDVHTGGVDHIGTHHTNEIAQTKAAFNTDLAKYWLHNEHLLVEGQKMSKSAGNYFTLKDVIDKGFSPAALRLLFLQAHYRSQMNFTWDVMAAAQKRLLSFQALADMRFQASEKAQAIEDNYFASAKTKIKESLANDLATPAALAEIEAVADEVFQKGIQPDNKAGFIVLLNYIDENLGLRLLESSDISGQQLDLIGRREQARADKDWNKSDEIRQTLQEQGIDVSDMSYGQIWRRT